jgi:putative transposase
MPARNVTKQYTEDSYYHVYNRGVEKREIFLEDEDYKIFLAFLKRHLSRHKEINGRNQEYESYAGRIELLAYCLMPNHYHLLFYLNNDTKAISELMRKVAGTYTAYFNRKYNRVGYLFQGTYKASKIDSDEYLLHITRYIHRNPSDYYKWAYSSLQYYIGDWKADWVIPDRIYKLYEWGTYESFLNEYSLSPELEEQLFS